MRSSGRGGLSPGDTGDPVADSIRAQQNADAAPSPDEINSHPECDNCGDADGSVVRRELVRADCSALQYPDKPWKLLCKECEDKQPSLREKHRQKAQKHLNADRHDDPVAIAFYGCGRAQSIASDESDEMPPHLRDPPKAPIKCGCGEPLADIELLDDAD